MRNSTLKHSDVLCLSRLFEKEIIMKFKVLSFALSAFFLLSLSAHAATVFNCCDKAACCDGSDCCK
jgi:hypothetical protein